MHKPAIPLRPIVSFVGSPSYELSKHYVYLLSPLVGKTTSHVKNSIEFTSFISEKTLESTQILVSFDVVSLFTNVPVDLACQVAGTRLQLDESLMDRSSPSLDQILTLLRFCLNATYLVYRGNFSTNTPLALQWDPPSLSQWLTL